MANKCNHHSNLLPSHCVRLRGCDIKFNLLNMRDKDTINIYQTDFNAVGAIAINEAYVSHKSNS